jgi:hypothetical protein
MPCMPCIECDGRFHFWSLLEIMKKFDAWGLAKLLGHIDERKASAVKMCDLGGRDQKLSDKEVEVLLSGILHLAQHHAKEAVLQSTLDRVWDNGPFMMKSKVGITWQELQSELGVLRQSIEADLEKLDFVSIHPNKAVVMRGMERDWGRVWEVIPRAKADTEEAVYCYALERNTATVFHSMRVAEFGLRHIARKVGVKLIDKGKPQPIEFATWDKVIQGINAQIAVARTLPQGPRRNARLKFYSDVAEQCAWIRDIWRNEVSHTRKNWNDAEALGVLNRVRDFMSLLSSQESRKKDKKTKKGKKGKTP